MKRYLLFSGLLHNSGGGWNDFVESFDEIQEAVNYFLENIEDGLSRWYHIADTKTGGLAAWEIIKSRRQALN